MLSCSNHPSSVRSLVLCLLLGALALVAGPRGLAQEQSQTETNDQPVFSEYKGVRLGMTAEEARHKLGSPQDKGDTQDFYAFSDNETAQVAYDAQHQVASI